jgi:hypothetical protein
LLELLPSLRTQTPETIPGVRHMGMLGEHRPQRVPRDYNALDRQRLHYLERRQSATFE